MAFCGVDIPISDLWICYTGQFRRFNVTWTTRGVNDLNGFRYKVYVFDSNIKYYQHWVSIISIFHVTAAPIAHVYDRDSVKFISHHNSSSSSLVIPLQSFPNPLTPPAVMIKTVIAVVLSDTRVTSSIIGLEILKSQPSWLSVDTGSWTSAASSPAIS